MSKANLCVLVLAYMFRYINSKPTKSLFFNLIQTHSSNIKSLNLNSEISNNSFSLQKQVNKMLTFTKQTYFTP